MKKRWAISIGCVGALLLLISCASRSIETELREAFIGYNDACARGDLDAFRRLRARDEVDRIERILKDRGKALAPELITPRDPDMAKRLATLPTVQVRIKGSSARLALLDETPPKEREVKPSEVELTLVLFRKEDGIWKVVNFGPIQLPKTDSLKQGDLPEEVIPRQFRLPQ